MAFRNNRHPKGGWIGKIPPHITGWGNVTQTEADARLIAAAPDLLSAAKRVSQIEQRREVMVKEYPAGTCNAEDAWKEFGEWEAESWELLKDAIAKATGQSPKTKER